MAQPRSYSRSNPQSGLTSSCLDCCVFLDLRHDYGQSRRNGEERRRASGRSRCECLVADVVTEKSKTTVTSFLFLSIFLFFNTLRHCTNRFPPKWVSSFNRREGFFCLCGVVKCRTKNERLRNSIYRCWRFIFSSTYNNIHICIRDLAVGVSYYYCVSLYVSIHMFYDTNISLVSPGFNMRIIN
jgi:hypothetical protein